MSSSDKPSGPDLGPSSADIAPLGVRGSVGAIPLVGPMLAEIVAALIPNQRQDRLEAFVQLLDAKVDQASLESSLKSHRDETVDVFEDGAVQAARAYTEKRREYLATLVAHGMTGDRTAALEAKRLLGLMRELDDDQIILLMNYVRMYQMDRGFQELHRHTLQADHLVMASTDDERDRYAIRKETHSKLDRLGLVAKEYHQPRRNEEPRFDRGSGTLQIRSTQITHLGKLLLRRLGIAVDPA